MKIAVCVLSFVFFLVFCSVPSYAAKVGQFCTAQRQCPATNCSSCYRSACDNLGSKAINKCVCIPKNSGTVCGSGKMCDGKGNCVPKPIPPTLIDSINPAASGYRVCYNSIQFFTRNNEACVSGNFRMRFRLTNNSSQNIPVTSLTTLNQTHNNYPFYQNRSDWYDTVNIPASGSISRDITGLIESCDNYPENGILAGDTVSATNKLVEDDYTIHIGTLDYHTVKNCASY